MYMKAMKYILGISMMFGLSLGIKAQTETHWSCDVYTYEFDMAVYFSLTRNDKILNDMANYEIAAFCGDECRGVSVTQTVELADGNTETFGYIRIHSNNAKDETIQFMAYDKKYQKESPIEQTLTFKSQELVGLPSNPFVFNMKSISVLLDETSTDALMDAVGVDVCVKRTIKANEWSTLVLPFAMTETQVKEAFGNDVLLADFTGYQKTMDGDEIVGILMNFKTATTIEANHPCLIKVTSAIDEFSLENVDINPEEEPKHATIERNQSQWSELIGTYKADTKVPDKCLFISNNKFSYSVGKTKMKAFRAYFNLYDILSSAKEAESKIRFTIEEETTTIKELKDREVEGFNNQCSELKSSWHTLSGLRLRGKPVEKGTYIYNGKKVSIH